MRSPPSRINNCKYKRYAGAVTAPRKRLWARKRFTAGRYNESASLARDMLTNPPSLGQATA